MALQSLSLAQPEEIVTCAECKVIKLVDKNKSVDSDALDDLKKALEGLGRQSAFSVCIFRGFSTWHERQSVLQPQPLGPPVS
jgi:hypothetical protein